jgi:uracil-DNA glycosylase
MKVLPILLGQAPSAKGDGRAFTGPSGKTICRWLGVEDRDDLQKYFYLENLLQAPLPHNPDVKRKSSSFTPAEARFGCQNFLTRTRFRLRKSMGRDGYTDWIDSGGTVEVVVLGTKVWKGFGLPSHANWFEEQPVADDFRMVKFPHPSGLNLELNDVQFARETAARLRAIAMGVPYAPTS